MRYIFYFMSITVSKLKYFICLPFLLIEYGGSQKTSPLNFFPIILLQVSSRISSQHISFHLFVTFSSIGILHQVGKSPQYHIFLLFQPPIVPLKHRITYIWLFLPYFFLHALWRKFFLTACTCHCLFLYCTIVWDTLLLYFTWIMLWLKFCNLTFITLPKSSTNFVFLHHSYICFHFTIDLEIFRTCSVSILPSYIKWR